MPYALRGTAVVRSDTGAVVKDHPTREKALAHLRALKANVEESVPVLGALLDGFADKPSPDSWEGRFQAGDKVRVTVKGGEDIIGKAERPSSAKRDHVIVRPDGNAPHVEAHVDSVRLDSPAQHVQARKRLEQEQRPRGMLPAGQSGPSVSRAQARAVGATPAGLPVRESMLGALLEAFYPGEHPRGLRGRFVRAGHILTKGGIARVVTDADKNGISYRPIEGGTAGAVRQMSHDELNGWIVHDTRQRLNPAVVSREWQTALHVASRHGGPSTLPQYGGVGPQGASARERGASALTTEHADTRDKLTNLPKGSSYGLHGPRGQIGRVERTATGWQVIGPTEKNDRSHKTPSAAAGHAMRLQRKASESGGDVATRNYRAREEVRGMNDRQAARAEEERGRRAIIDQMLAGRKAQATRDEILRKSPGAQRELDDYQSVQRAVNDPHGGFKPGDKVTWQNPYGIDKHPGEVARKSRNGNLTIRTEQGTTVDVHHSKLEHGSMETTSNRAEQTRGAEVRRRVAERRRHEAAAGRRYAERHAPTAPAPQRRVSRALGMPVAHDDPFGVGALLEAFAPPNAGPLIAPKETPAQSAGVVKKQEAQLSQTIADFNAKHPRSAGGKFASKGGTAARAKGVRHSGTRARKASSSQGNTLTIGTTGALVRAVQRQLRIPADGKYGPQTKAAVERYQRQHGLQVDGVVGAQTLAALRGQNARRVTPGPISSRSARVVAPTRRSSRATPHRMLGGTVI